MSVVTQIAEAVVTELNGATFGQPIQAERQYLPLFELEQLKDLRVTVVPKSQAIEATSRSTNQHDIDIDIAVQKKLPQTTPAEIDPLMVLVQELADHFRFKRLTSPDAVWIKTQNEPVYAPEHLDRFRVFTSILTLTFRVLR